MSPTALPPEVRRGLPVLVGGRFAGNVGIRFAYPFLPAIARGLGISADTAGLALTIRELSGLAAPAAGRAIDRGRRRAGLLVGLVGCAAGLALAGAASGFFWFTVAVTGFGTAKMAYDTAMSTWIGDHVPWDRRGQVVGLGEVSWAASLLVAVPLLGLAIDAWGWRSAFFVVAGANLLAAVAVPATIAPDPPAGTVASNRLRLLPGALGLYATMGLLSFGIQLVVVSYGFWLEDDFGWSIPTIGIASILLGVGELCGTGTMILLADRLGKRRTLLIGTAALVPPLALLGTAGSSGLVGIALLAVAVTAFELAFVSGLPLITELDPDARGAGVGMALALVTVARAVGTIGGTTLYVRTGMGWTGLTAAVTIALAGVVTLLAVREPRSTAL